MVAGIAGENILVETERPVDLDEIAAGIVIEGMDGRRIELTSVSVAHPCVEFSRFVMGDPQAPSIAVSETLRFLGDGLRGYYALVEAREPLRIELGDRVFAVAQPAAREPFDV